MLCNAPTPRQSVLDREIAKELKLLHDRSLASSGLILPPPPSNNDEALYFIKRLDKEVNDQVRKISQIVASLLFDTLCPIDLLCQKVGVGIDELKVLSALIKQSDALQCWIKANAPGPTKFILWMMVQAIQDTIFFEGIQKHIFIFPDTLELHLGRKCPFSCRFCFRQVKAGRRQKIVGQSMSKEEIFRLIDLFKARGGKKVLISGGLESLTNPAAIDVISYASAKGLKIKFYTSGASHIFEDETKLYTLLTHSDQIRISVNAATRETYRAVQNPQSWYFTNKRQYAFDIVVHQNIPKLIQIRKELTTDGIKTARLGISFVIDPVNYNETEGAIYLWEGKVDYIAILSNVLSDDSSWNLNALREAKKTIFRIEKKVQDGAYKTDVIINRHPPKGMFRELEEPLYCFAPLKKVVVNTTYRIVWPCCVHASIWYPKYEVGRLNCAWNLENILRENYCFDGEGQSLFRFPDFPSCASCTDWEKVFNLCVRKLLDDENHGIYLEDQLLNTQIFFDERWW